MKFTIETDDAIEVRRLMKADDMANMLWELQHNFWRKWKHDEGNFTLNNYKDELLHLFLEHNIYIDDLTG